MDVFVGNYGYTANYFPIQHQSGLLEVIRTVSLQAAAL